MHGQQNIKIKFACLHYCLKLMKREKKKFFMSTNWFACLKWIHITRHDTTKYSYMVLTCSKSH